MRRKHTPDDPPVPPLNDLQTRVLLVGYDKHQLNRGHVMRELLFASSIINDPELWKRHEAFLLSEAKRLGIQPPPNDFYGRRIYRTWTDAKAKWEYRQQHGDGDESTD
jgi:hypothetical protein